MIELPKSIHRSQDDLPSDAEELKDCQGDCKNGTFFLLYAESDEFLLEAVSAVQHSGRFGKLGIWVKWLMALSHFFGTCLFKFEIFLFPKA